MVYNFQILEPTKKETLTDIDKQFQSELEYIEILYIISISIENYREKYNLTQKQLANKLQVSQEMISKLESGKCNISIKKLVEIWNKLSNNEYDFTSRLLNQIMQKTRDNYNRIYCNNYICTFKVHTNGEEKEIKPEKLRSYNKKYTMCS